MNEPIRPALTCEEWEDVDEKDIHGWDDGNLYVGRPRSKEGDLDITDRPHALIALANAALPDDDPRKITHESVAVIRAAGDNAAEWGHDLAAAVLRGVADGLRSYLPPEKP